MAYITEITQLKQACLHHVGSKAAAEGIVLSDKPLQLDEASLKNLYTYCLSSFKEGETFCFHNELSLQFNEVCACVGKIFADPQTIVEQSQNLAKVLYEHSEHPGIKSGDFIVAYFTDCQINGYVTDAVGLYKCENQTSFLSVMCEADNVEIITLQGLDLKHVDKAALIFNANADEGYSLAIIDNTNRTEAKFWVDDFLQAKPCADEYRHTRTFLNATKAFITKELPATQEVSRGEQAELMDKALRYFKENETFEMDDFNQQVIGNEVLSADFGLYVDDYMVKNDLEPAESFAISESAVKKSQRSMKSVIKLDRNFHIYVYGGEGLIKKGYDEETGMEYYQLYFKKEE